jgi:hypothetical protein
MDKRYTAVVSSVLILSFSVTGYRPENIAGTLQYTSGACVFPIVG